MCATYCSYCGLQINEDSDINKGKKYVMCKHYCIMTPKGSVTGKLKKELIQQEHYEYNKLHYKKMKGGKKNKMEQEKEEPKAAPLKWGKLKCSVCGEEKFSNGQRIIQYAGKPYFCRKCKAKKAEDENKKEKDVTAK